jgi:hypothetical protein
MKCVTAGGFQSLFETERRFGFLFQTEGHFWLLFQTESHSRFLFQTETTFSLPLRRDSRRVQHHSPRATVHKGEKIMTNLAIKWRNRCWKKGGSVQTHLTWFIMCMVEQALAGPEFDPEQRVCLMRLIKKRVSVKQR